MQGRNRKVLDVGVGRYDDGVVVFGLERLEPFLGSSEQVTEVQLVAVFLIGLGRLRNFAWKDMN